MMNWLVCGYCKIILRLADGGNDGGDGNSSVQYGRCGKRYGTHPHGGGWLINVCKCGQMEGVSRMDHPSIRDGRIISLHHIQLLCSALSLKKCQARQKMLTNTT